jgi:GT2 family glycosyltransferase
MKITDLSIIIVSYNTADLTLACIESITKTIKKHSYEIIVVDNDSKDNSVAQIRGLHEDRIIVIENIENYGFSKANNIGVKKSSGRYVLFLNSDTVVHGGTIDGMIEFMDGHERAGAATCRLEMPNGKLDDASHRGFPTPLRSLFHFSGIAGLFPNSIFFNGYHLGWQQPDREHEIESLAGAFMITRRTAGDEVGWWDEEYFWYGEDIDFCYRLKLKGWQIFYVPQYSILHYKGASGGLKKESQQITKANTETKLRATNARFEAMKIFYRKHYTSRYPKFLTQFVFLGIDAKKFLTKKRMGI